VPQSEGEGPIEVKEVLRPDESLDPSAVHLPSARPNES
jgi:hypothetical protein